MNGLLQDLLVRSAERYPENQAVVHQDDVVSYAVLAETASLVAIGLVHFGLRRQDRVAVYLSKRPETVAAIFGTTMAGGVFVPVNPLLKPAQLVHILRDCNVRILIASAEMFPQIRSVLSKCADLRLVVGVGPEELPDHQGDRFSVVPWGALLDHGPGTGWHRTIDADMAAIFYTSGSTGNPKGVVLSHQNMVAGATSVVRYLDNRSTDRLLAVLPLSFDYGFSQLSTGFLAGATVVLMDYLFPKDVIEVAERHQVTGLAGVPPLWIQIAKRSWPDSVVRNLRYVTNSGGAMPRVTLDLLRAKLPETRVFLMYGLTEAFRSTFLSPDELDRRPDSIGKAIPNAEILVVREDGSRCAPGEPGELVHRGALVALGYWNDAEKTARRFRPVPDPENGLVIPELAVWSGDTVTEDQDGFLYFVGRRDDMIKTSGYRVSPTEVETAVYAVEIVAEAIAVGVPHSLLGQGIVVVVVKTHDHQGDDEMNTEMILAECRRRFGRPGTQTAG